MTNATEGGSGQLKAFIERVETINTEIAERNEKPRRCCGGASQEPNMSNNQGKPTKITPTFQVVGTPKITHGDASIGPELAKWILENCFYSGQEKRMKTARINILRHVVRLRRGRWIQGSQITLAQLPGGAIVLVNGYHRLSAIVEYGAPAHFNVQIVPVKDHQGIDSLYSLFDRAKDSRVRPNEQANNALHVDDRLGVSKTVAKSLIQSVLIIQNGFRPVKPGDREPLVEFDSVEDRLELAVGWAKEAKILDAIFAKARGPLKRKLLGASVFTVALATVRHQPMKAQIFWESVAKNDGLRNGAPEHSLVNWLLTYRIEPNTPDGLIGAALAWNAFYQNRGITHLKVGATVGFRICGTPIDLRGRK